MSGGFVWDDSVFVNEPVIRDWSGIGQIWFSPGDIRSEGHYWPVVYSSFWLEHKLWGLDPAGFHIVNILLHLANCLLVWRLLSRLSVPGAWLAAAVFAVHPLRVESVAWVIERKDLLSGLFCLLTALVWIRADGKPAKLQHCLATGLFAAAMLSKSIAVTLPASLLVWHLWKQGRCTSADLARLAPLFALAAGITLADLSFYQGREPLDLGYTAWERVQIAATALWWYAGKTVWPGTQAVIYPHWTVDAADVLAWWPLGAGAAAVAGLWLARKRTGWGPAAGVAFFVITLSPTLGLIDYGYMQFSFVADRFQYLAGLGLIAVVTAGAARWAAGLRGWSRLGAKTGAACMLAALAAATWLQAGVYRDGTTLFSHVVSKNPTARDAYLNLSAALLGKGRLEEALEAASTAIEQRTAGLAKAHLNAARALLGLGRLGEAEEQLAKSLDLAPRNAAAIKSQADVLAKRGDHARAVEGYRRALSIDHRQPHAAGALANSLFELERFEESIEAARDAMARSDDPARISDHLTTIGRAWQRLGEPREAEEALRRARELAPDRQPPLLALADLYREMGLAAQSEEQLDRAKQLLPGREDSASERAVATRNVADWLRRQERYEAALEVFREALELHPESALTHAGLGHTLHSLERYEEAVDHMRRALALDPELPMAGTLHGLLGEGLSALGRLEEAEAHLLAGLEIDSSDADKVDRLGLLTYSQKRYREAEQWYQQLIRLRPRNAQAFANLAAARYFVGKRQQSIEAFEQALQIDPDSQAARTGLAQIRAAGRTSRQ